MPDTARGLPLDDGDVVRLVGTTRGAFLRLRAAPGSPFSGTSLRCSDDGRATWSGGVGGDRP